MIAIAAGGFAVGRIAVPRTESSAIAVRFSVVADALVPQRGSEGTVAVSVDGRLFVFIGQFEGTRVLFLRRIDRDVVSQIPGTADAASPFLSPDGRWVAFFREGQLLKVPLEGGPAQRIADAPSGRGGVWRADGTIFFAPTFSGPIVQVSANGGVPQPVTVLDAKAGEDSHRFPELMPNDDVLLFTARHGAGFEDATVAAVRLSTGERMTLITGGVKGRYVPTGHLIFARATTLMAVALDAQSLEVRGSPTALLDGVNYRSLGGVSDFAVSDTGTLAYVPTSAQAAELARVQLDGAARSLGVPPAPFRAISLSPDGRFGVVITDRGERADLHILDVRRGILRPLSRGYRDDTPFWHPDGARIIFSSSRRAPTGLFSVTVGAAEQPHEIPSAGQWRFITSIAPDGRTVLYGNVSPETGWDIWMQPIDGAAPGRKLLGTPANERYAALSPDGRTLVFGSDESGRDEVYAVTYPGLEERTQVSVSGGSEPVWAHSGRELFYRAGDALMAVKVDAGQRLNVGAPTVVFRAPFLGGHEFRKSYDVFPDDRGFVIVRTSGEPEKARINIIQNWFEELKAKVPTGGQPK
jgi:serine/threonine-protein kinase